MTEKEYRAHPAISQRIKELATDTISLSKHLGCSVQAVNQYKNGTSYPKTENLIKIADFYGVSLDYLLGRTFVKSPDNMFRYVCEYTGLSEVAIKEIINHRDSVNELSELVCLNPFWALIRATSDYLKGLEGLHGD